MKNLMDQGMLKVKTWMLSFKNDTRGDIGVKQIALAVAGLVVIGVMVGFLTGWLPDLIEGEIWPWMWDQITGFFG